MFVWKLLPFPGFLNTFGNGDPCCPGSMHVASEMQERFALPCYDAGHQMLSQAGPAHTHTAQELQQTCFGSHSVSQGTKWPTIHG